MKSSDLEIELYEAFPQAQLILMDREYALPTLKSFKARFPSTLEHNLRALSVSSYVATTNDCDNFAFFAFWCARIAEKPKGKEIAFGILLTESHAMNLLATLEKGKIKFYAFEPQTGELSTPVWESITHIIM